MLRNLVFVLTVKAQSGKDTVAVMIQQLLKSKYESSSIQLAYADVLKDICVRNYGYRDKDKDRAILQNVGDVIRQNNEDYFVHVVWDLIVSMMSNTKYFIVTDARFENEMRPEPYNHYLSIVNVYIDNKNKHGLRGDVAKHESEQIATTPDLSKFDYVIDNSKDLEDTFLEVMKMVDNVIDNQARAYQELREETGLDVPQTETKQ